MLVQRLVSQAFRQGRRLQTARTLHLHTVERALKLMSSEHLKAFDLDEVPKAVQESYGNTNFVRGCLVEQGVQAVEVTLQGFDSHANNFVAHQQNGAILDPAIARLVQELKERDLFDSTAVLCISKFSRTPKVNPLDGRGLHSGLVLGATDPEGNEKNL